MFQLPKDFQVDFEKTYEKFNFSVQLQRKGLQQAPSPYWLWIYTVMVEDVQVYAGHFPWSNTLERVDDEEVADMISKEHAYTSLIDAALKANRNRDQSV